MADSEGNSVEQFSAAGAYEAKWNTAGSGSGQFLEPLGVATGSLDTFWVSDTATTGCRSSASRWTARSFGSAARG